MLAAGQCFLRLSPPPFIYHATVLLENTPCRFPSFPPRALTLVRPFPAPRKFRLALNSFFTNDDSPHTPTHAAGPIALEIVTCAQSA